MKKTTAYIIAERSKVSGRSIRGKSMTKATAYVIAERRALRKRPDFARQEQERQKERQRQLDSPVYNASQALGKLFLQAQGMPCNQITGWGLDCAKPVPEEADPVVIQAYAMIVCEHVAKLNSLIEKHRESLLQVSQNCFSWPMRIGRRKAFGDDTKQIVKELQVGQNTIASDPRTRFNINRRFGKVAWNLIARIEQCRTTPGLMWVLSRHSYSWANAARTLPPFKLKMSSDDQKEWLAVIKQVLDEDFRDPEQTKVYRKLITAKSHQNRWKTVFLDKIQWEFYSLWGWHRKAKVPVVPSSHAS
jgi:hypothetical protein